MRSSQEEVKPKKKKAKKSVEGGADDKEAEKAVRSSAQLVYPPHLPSLRHASLDHLPNSSALLICHPPVYGGLIG